MDEFNAGELSPGPKVQSEEEILAWVARDAETALHPSCTAAMGTGEMAVTDPGSLRVRGLDGLRVVDASVMPYVTNGNIYAPVMMVAEKAADLILGNTPLPAERVEFYRRANSPTTWDSLSEPRHSGYHVTMIELHRWHAASVLVQRGANRA
jgi:choline dehydrogenase